MLRGTREVVVHGRRSETEPIRYHLRARDSRRDQSQTLDLSFGKPDIRSPILVSVHPDRTTTAQGVGISWNFPQSTIGLPVIEIDDPPTRPGFCKSRSNSLASLMDEMTGLVVHDRCASSRSIGTDLDDIRWRDAERPPFTITFRSNSEEATPWSRMARVLA